MTIGAAFKRILPRTLLGRSVMIIVTPLIVLQVVSTAVFYGRHWEHVTRRLADAVAGEISMVIENMRQFPGAANEDLVLRSAGRTGLRIRYLRGEILPNVAPEIGSGILDRRLSNALAHQVRRPFHMDSWRNERDVSIKIQLAGGVLDVVVSRKRLFSSTTYIFVMWMVGTSLVLFAVASVFMRNQVGPIRRLAVAADSFGKGRDVPDIKPEGATEIRTAAAAFNLMRERIQRTMAQRTTMLAGVSHDLRTPLTRMKLELEMLGADRDVDELKYDVSEMEKLVEEYLAFARGESTEAVAAADIGTLLEEVVSGARRGGAAVELAADAGMTVPVRRNGFKRCVANLIANAALNADNIAVRAGRNDDAIEIVIDDDGPGVPPEEREEVFRPFYRLDGSRNPETGGTGLGLTIARDVMRGHGGDVRLEDSPRGGVRARLRLPV